LGHEIEETDEHRKLRTRLENAGLTSEQATEVLSKYPTDVVAQQLDWLPYRKAKNPTGYLLAAIDGGYQEPRAIRDRRFVLEEKFGSEAKVELVTNDEEAENDMQLEIDGAPILLPSEE
jgi:hypothetical protein